MLPKLNQKPKQGIVPALSEGASIPKIIHQTFRSKVLPQALLDNVAELKRLNPGWEYRFYDDSELVDFIASSYGPRILESYNRISKKYGAAKADLARYLLLYKCGGVYLDIKSSARKPLGDVIRADDVYLLSGWKNCSGEQFEGWGLHPELKHIDGGEFQQWHVVAAPGHPFLRAVIENVLANIDRYNPVIHGTGAFGTVRVTGPVAYTLAIAPLLANYRHRFADSESELGFTYSVLGSPAAREHKAAFGVPHYTQLTESLVELRGFKKRFVSLYTGIKKLRGS